MSRRRRLLLSALAVVLVVGAVLTERWFLHPDKDDPGQADAVFVLGGGGERVEFALDLVREGVAAVFEFPARRDGDACLADTARADERDRSVLANELRDGLQVVVAPDELLGRRREHGSGRTDARAQRPAVAVEAAGLQHEEALGADATKLVGAGGHDFMAADEIDDVVGGRDLPAVGNIHDARRTIDGRAEVVVAVGFGFTDIQSDTDPKRFTVAPIALVDSSLDRHRSVGRSLRRDEDGADAVTRALEYDSAAFFDTPVEQRVVDLHGRTHLVG